MYKILNDHSAPNLKQLFNKRNEAQTSYNLRNNQTDITLPTAVPRTLIGGVFIHIFMFCPTSFFWNQIQIYQLENKLVGQNMNIWINNPAINVLATALTLPNPKTEYLKRTLGYNGAKL